MGRVLPLPSGIPLPLPTSGKYTRIQDARLGVQQTGLLWAPLACCHARVTMYDLALSATLKNKLPE